MNNPRSWRVVRLSSEGTVAGSFGDFHDEATARRIQDAFADQGAVLQHQQSPTIHPWVTVPIDNEEVRDAA